MATVAEARTAYLTANGFTLADYDAPWVKLRLGRIPLGFPNSRARRAAVPLHDLHHIATGYETTWRGEGEIAAWELAAGCGRYWAAWGLNAGAMLIGLVLAPRRVVRAFVRGRRSKSLYQLVRRAESTERAGSIDELLALPVDELRARLRLA
ncbi:MAG: hypothetical protein IPL61_25815 [Myxococcales bacterium]|nr:hypothetical protein [Myxococcales bacterium]